MEHRSAEEPKIYNPWNLANRLIPDDEILRILRQFGVTDTPRNWDLFRQACVHSSYVDRPEGPSLLKDATAPLSSIQKWVIKQLVRAAGLIENDIHKLAHAINSHLGGVENTLSFLAGQINNLADAAGSVKAKLVGE